MDISSYSRSRLMGTFSTWQVPKDFADPMYNYLIFGYNPGSCFTSVLANDFMSAIARSHPANTIEAFKALAGWIRDTMPAESYGSMLAVRYWTNLSSEDRRAVLETHQLIYTAKQETMLRIKGDPVQEPMLW